MVDISAKYNQINNDHGGILSVYLVAMNSQCVHCKKTITPEEGAFFCLGEPYYGVVHRKCAPFFQFNGLWPHAFPSVVYQNLQQQQQQPRWPINMATN
jgi:hypothetical protein